MDTANAIATYVMLYFKLDGSLPEEQKKVKTIINSILDEVIEHINNKKKETV